MLPVIWMETGGVHCALCYKPDGVLSQWVISQELCRETLDKSPLKFANSAGRREPFLHPDNADVEAQSEAAILIMRQS